MAPGDEDGVGCIGVDGLRESNVLGLKFRDQNMMDINEKKKIIYTLMCETEYEKGKGCEEKRRRKLYIEGKENMRCVCSE